MRRVVIAGLVVSIIASFLNIINVRAIDPKARGLLVTPIREYKTVDPGKTSEDTVTVANLTKNPIDVTLSAEQFSVTNFTYDYIFQQPHEEWIKFTAPTVHLGAGEGKAIKYQLAIPKTAEPGGHYFTLLASTSLKPNEKVRAATMLYVTVSGKLVKTSTILDDFVPFISFGGDIPFRFTARNTGNTHFFAYISGKLEGLSAQNEKNNAAHILLPQTLRTVTGSFSAPLLPGVYKATYGYKTDSGVSVTHEKYLLYTPLWGWAILGGVTWLLILWLKQRHRSRRLNRPVY
jgi:hypothetical protein